MTQVGKKVRKRRYCTYTWEEGKIRRRDILQSALVERGDELIMHKRILLFPVRVFLETQRRDATRSVLLRKFRG